MTQPIPAVGVRRFVHTIPSKPTQKRLHECKQTPMQIRADRSFWLAYAAKNNIQSDGDHAVAAARAHSYWMDETAIVVWPNGRETRFIKGVRA